MTLPRALGLLIHSSDGGIRRLLRYWALGLVLYLVSLATLWCEVWLGVASGPAVTMLTAASLGGAAVAYGAIRTSRRFGLAPGALNTAQCLYAITCITSAYGLVGPMRGVTLSILVVVLVFGGFSATPGQMRAMCAYAITVLGLTIVWKSSTDATRYPAHEEWVHFVLAGTMLVAVAYLAELLSRLRKKLKSRTRELASALARIEELATRDELTQLFNRRHMAEAMRQQDARRARSGEPMCVAVIDIDHFKRLNDTLGHATGDAALKFFAGQALATLRASDLLARWGGEEFLLLLPATEVSAGQAVLERMRMRIGEAAWHGTDPTLRLRFSAGLAAWAVGQPAESAIEAADRALYRAKQAGRDRIETADRA